MPQKRRNAFLLLIVACITSSAAILPFPSPLPSVSKSYDEILKNTWDGIKKRLIDPYSIPLVHRPRSEEPHDAVSEGVGYGMLLALYCNDQTYFNKIWDSGEQYMYDDNGSCYNWRVSRDGTVIGTGAASDADQDIALALIFADALVKKQVWKSHTGPKGADYATRAQNIINNLWSSMVEDGRYLRPGNGWGGRAFVNPGYFAPAFYRVFSEFETEKHNWNAVIDQSYQTIEASPGYTLGLVPDWMQPDGNYSGNDQLGYNAYAGGQFMYKDAIRVLWRVATDYIWYNEPRAKEYCDNALAFIKSADRANFFQMDGSAVTESFVLGNDVERPRTEHSELTIGMWACAVMAAGGPEAAEPFSDELLRYYEGGDYWGKASDANNEDTLHNEMYFEQFLAWFGASLISGVFTNLWDDFKDPNPEIAPELSDVPEVAPFDIDANKKPLTIRATFNKNVRWTVEIRHRDDAACSVIYGGSGEEIDLQWNGTAADGSFMKQGAYTVTISARGCKKPYSTLVWLGRALDLKSGERLIVDNFADGDLRPFIGASWASYTEQSDGKSGKTSIKRLAVTTDEGEPALKWDFRLDGSQSIGFNAYAALEWNCAAHDSSFTLAGLDTIVVYARSATAPLNVSVQIITSDIGDYTYFEDSICLDMEFKEYRLPVGEFRQRLGGSGRQLDLSKCTAMRFQVQDVDGTENGIYLAEMLFAGNLAKLYSSPPAYIKPEKELGTRNHREGALDGKISVIRNRDRVSFSIPAASGGWVQLSVSDMCGKRVVRSTFTGTAACAWNYRTGDGGRVAPGTYVVTVKTATGSYRIPLLLLP